MKLHVYKSLWGMTGPIERQVEHIKAAGYEGIESAAQDIADPPAFQHLLKESGLHYIALVYTEGIDHAEELKRRTADAMKYHPKKIVAHAGRDTMSFGKTIRFFEQALRI